MNDIIEIGDRVWADDNEVSTILSMDRSIGMYLLENGRVLYRHQFTPMKWEEPKVCSTGLGVCAAGAAGQ
ncbi:hypothetical protein [Sinorhizobium meliloti]|uniref:hypothetical protein n=1 Tax=Rhizobium meliloti TaxID=382 RepID=UPI000FD81B2F|nr:hypothetical protein [Sinorhizobium meliloti]RVG88707.1 hypothetical protein CN219_03820 [Sinorhizobium meliloti]RVI39011.1 hypothetical protein CN197_02415 [Sinorhizobium meliloti]RVI46647.1 hypothetical protein CN196_09265 [Sinorhizobium meliloti]RVJ25648.1 hypothetical protein CN177_13305 [Sinorhizobium meliloti]RVK02273.1 hypothetical protein CN170_08825 [Sinorhizobium meliloti]